MFKVINLLRGKIIRVAHSNRGKHITYIAKRTILRDKNIAQHTQEHLSQRNAHTNYTTVDFKVNTWIQKKTLQNCSFSVVYWYYHKVHWYDQWSSKH